VNEARASMGLGPWQDSDGDLSISEFMAKHSTTIADAAKAADGAQESDS